MKTSTPTVYKKDDQVCLYLLIGYFILIALYLITMYLWIKGLWNVPFCDLKVKHGVGGTVWIKTGHVIYKWSRKNIFPNCKG
jgi:hypothetical protein